MKENTKESKRIVILKTKENNWNQRHLLGQENIAETIWWSKVMDVLPALPNSKKIGKNYYSFLTLLMNTISDFEISFV